MSKVAVRIADLGIPGWSADQQRVAIRWDSASPPPRRGATLALGALVALISLIAFGLSGALAPAARADGDPGSDVLVYQDLFVPADSGVSVQQQVRLGNLLTAAKHDGFTIRVAIVAQPDDLGAVTALWGKPAAYAQFLGIELSLAYKQPLLIVMPNGFGFNWPGHPTADAYRLLGKIPVGHGGSGLAAATETAVRTLAAASGVTIPASAGAGSAAASSRVPSAAGAASGGQAVFTHSSRPPLPLLLAAVLAAALLITGLGWLARRRGPRLVFWRHGPGKPAGPAMPRPASAGWSPPVPGSPLAARPAPVPRPAPERAPGWRRRLAPAVWLAPFAAAAVAMYAAYVVAGPHSTAQGTTGSGTRNAALESNPDIDPGTELSGPAPGFTLTDQFGQPVSLSSYRGKVVILAFVDSECTTTCPLTTAAMLDAKAMLGTAGQDVQLVGVNANPKATAIEDMRSYSELHGMTHQWHFLTGSLPELKSVWKDYSVGVTINQNTISHSSAVFVISPQGKLARLYMSQQAYASVGQTGQLMAQEASSLLPGHPPVRSHLSYAQIAGASPATAITLPRAGGGTVRLGPGQARLYLFFATWDQEITSLAGHLDGLSAYESRAKASGLPPLTAVDEGSVEPSPSALQRFLNTVPHPLSYPVAVDATGRVADGYGVQGAPWFALVSRSGTVLWSWEVSTAGWLTPASLASHVQAALTHSPA